jgi:N-acetyl-alpha-D-muramate 1-phosphate uridylyltransferase
MTLVTDTAMVMAAGLGKRMRPLTAAQPKPLVRVAGKALIDHALDRLRDAGVGRAVVNVHYLRLERSAPAVTISDERDGLLETGGGMIKAQAAGLLPDPFFCVNADSIWLDGPQSAFADLSAHWDPARMDALLLVVPHARAHNFTGAGDFYMDPAGRLRRKLPGRVAPYIYTGIQLVSHRLLRAPPPGAFSTNILWNRAIEEGRLYGTAFTGQWLEVGEPRHIAAAEGYLAGG